MSKDIEQVLREAMQEAAGQVLQEGRELPAFPQAHSGRGNGRSGERGIRRFGPLAAAAAVLVIAAGATLGVAISSADTGTSPAGGSTSVPQPPSESRPDTAPQTTPGGDATPEESAPAPTPEDTDGSSPQPSSDRAPQSSPGGDATPGD